MPGSTPEAAATATPAGVRGRTVPGNGRGASTLLAGRYELGRVVGGGGMGTVHRARDRTLDRAVAVKLLPVGRAGDENLVLRFMREARAAAALSHPNIVCVFDAGSDDSTRFIVMELVQGESLAELLSREVRLAPARAADLAAQTARGLAAAHRAGIVHRDVKPANVMVDATGLVKLLDFGIARAHATASLTQVGFVLGSSHYMAPEVSRGMPAVPESDVYSLGCLLYELLTGRRPFTGDLAAAVLHQHVASAPTPPRTLRPQIPPGLDALVMRMLAKSPADRPGARELVPALERFAGASRRSRPARPRRAADEHTVPRLLPVHRRRGLRLAAAGALVVVLAASGFALAGAGGRDRGLATAAHAAAPKAGASSAAARRWALAAPATTTWRLAAALAAAALAQLEAASAAAVPQAPPPPAHRRHRAPPAHARGHGHRHAEPAPASAETQAGEEAAAAPPEGGAVPPQGGAAPPEGEAAPSPGAAAGPAGPAGDGG